MDTTSTPSTKSGFNAKFIIGGLLIVVAVAYLIFSSTQASAQYFFTVDELAAKAEESLGREVRISGAVIGDTVEYDAETLTLTFDIAHVSGDNKEIEAQGGLAKVLYDAVNDPTRTRMTAVYVGPKPDLLRHEAQAIMTGTLGEDGVFYADELLLKCPTRYEESVPGQADS